MSVKSISPVGIQELGGLPEHPLQTLARAARMMNPGQMDIPKSFIPHIQLPGESNLSSCQIIVFISLMTNILPRQIL